MVNLTFYRLESTDSINSDNSEAQHSSISIYISLSAGRSFMLEFLLWSFKIHLIRCFPKASVLLVFCCSDFVFQERSAFLTDPEGRSVSFVDLGHDPICWKLWYHVGFFQTTAGVRSDRYRFIFWTFWFFLISSADSVYFCAFVLFWLEIRLITIFPVCYW